MGISDLLEPDEELLENFNELMEDVEVFLGREFEDEPVLVIVPEGLNSVPFLPDISFNGKYTPKAHQVIYNPHGFEAKRYEVNENRLEASELDTARVKNGLESLQSKTEGDVLLEELLHAKHAEELGYSQPDYSLNNLKPSDFITDPFGENVAGYVIEGFADFCRSYLSDNRSHQDTENVLGFIKEASKISTESGLPSLDQAAQMYVGHLFFRAFNNQNVLDETFRIALSEPWDYDDLPDVFQTVEDSNLDYGSELWKFARNHMEEIYV